MVEDFPVVSANAFVSLVAVCDKDPDIELAAMSTALQERYPMHELVVTVRSEAPGPPRLPSLHVLSLAPPADDRVRLAAALDRCLGDIIVIVDPARDDPQAMLQAAALVGTGEEAVYEVPTRAEGGLRRWARHEPASRISRAVGVSAPPVAGVRACNREVLLGLLAHPDRDRLLAAFPAVTGHGWRALPTASASAEGRSPLRWRLAALLAGSAAPLRWASALGVIAAVMNLIYSAYVVVINVVQGTVEGWTSLSLQMAGMFLLLSIVLALIAEYVYQLVKRGRERPLYRVRTDATSPSLPSLERLNVEDPAGNPLA